MIEVLAENAAFYASNPFNACIGQRPFLMLIRY